MGKHIEDIHASPSLLCALADKQERGCSVSWLLGGNLVMLGGAGSRHPKRRIGWAWSKVGGFSSLGCCVCGH